MGEQAPLHPYEPRAVSFRGTGELRGFRLKLYSIVFTERMFESEVLESAMRASESELPSPAATPERPGVGIGILHLGRGADYFVLAWWDRENELPMRVFVKDADGWRTAKGGESICVWDLRVLWHEREAYVRTILSGHAIAGGALVSYLSQTYEGHA